MIEHLNKVVSGEYLSEAEAEELMGMVFTSATDAQIAALLVALKIRGESEEEITGFARGMRAAATLINPSTNGLRLVDTCGTGGDGAGTINVSTAAALIVAAAGVPVAKHGNHSITSRSGSADVLAEVGVPIDLSPEDVEHSIEEYEFGFLYAPRFHPSMKRVAHIRREMGMRTVFNIMGPLTNPASPSAQVIGVYDPALCEVFALVLNRLGVDQALVVNGSGTDEITTVAPTKVTELKDGRIDSYVITPEDFGLLRAKQDDLLGGMPTENATYLINVLSGKDGPHLDISILNAGAALYVSGEAKSIQDGLELARATVEDGLALSKLKEIVDATGDMGRLGRFIQG